MRIFLDTEVLMGLADQNSDIGQLLNHIKNLPNFSIWISAGSIIRVHDKFSKILDSDKVYDRLKFIQENFSIIPLRQAILSKVLKNNQIDFDDQIQMISAITFKMDCIITGHVAQFSDSDIPAYTTAVFMEKLKAGEFESVSKVQFLDLKAQHHQVYNEIDDRITDIIINTAFILGTQVDEFEKRFAEMHGAKYALGVSSGTAALHIALMALGIGPGDQVIVPVNTFIATAEAVSLCEAVPVFVDCDQYYNMDPEKIREILQNTKDEIGHRPTQTDTDILSGRHSRTKTVIASRENIGRIRAVIPVHLYGQPANMDKIMALADEYNLSVVEDCCQAHLARWRDKRVGNFGAFGAFSFYPGKNLGAYGEAGALVCNDEALYLKAKQVRQHGEIERYHHSVVGHNYRMEAFQGAVLSTKLKYIAEWTRKRQENARLYTELLANIEGVQTPRELEGVDPVYHLYVIQTDDRDGLRDYLQEHGVASGLHYPVPLHLQEAYEELGYGEGDFPVAEKAAGRILSLPMYPELGEGQIQYVCEQIKNFMNQPQTHTD